MLAHDSGQVQVCRRNVQANFLHRFAAGAGVGRLAAVRLQLAAARTPEAEIRFLASLEQQDFVPLVETVEQGGDFVG